MKVRVMANGPFYSCLVSDLGLQHTVYNFDVKVRVMANRPFYSCLVSDLGLQRTVLIWKFVLWPIDHFTVVWSVTLDYSVHF